MGAINIQYFWQKIISICSMNIILFIGIFLFSHFKFEFDQNPSYFPDHDVSSTGFFTRNANIAFLPCIPSSSPCRGLSSFNSELDWHTISRLWYELTIYIRRDPHYWWVFTTISTVEIEEEEEKGEDDGCDKEGEAELTWDLWLSG